MGVVRSCGCDWERWWTRGKWIWVWGSRRRVMTMLQRLALHGTQAFYALRDSNFEFQIALPFRTHFAVDSKVWTKVVYLTLGFWAGHAVWVGIYFYWAKYITGCIFYNRKLNLPEIKLIYGSTGQTCGVV